VIRLLLREYTAVPTDFRAIVSHQDHLLVRPWIDPLVDRVGHDTRSLYVERFWLGILGPSACWFLRYVAQRLEASPDGFDLDLDTCAATIGVGRRRGPTAAFHRMLNRCHDFKVLRAAGAATIEVRRSLAPLTARQVARLSSALREEHARWVDVTPTAAEATVLQEQARRLALTLLRLGEPPVAAEHQLQRWRFEPALARTAVAWALAHDAADTRAATIEQRPLRDDVSPGFPVRDSGL
jgi:hypothetical protein